MNLADVYKSAELDELTRTQLDRLKLLPNRNFICEVHELEVEFSSLDRHHAIPQEAGGLDTADNIKYLCVGCHQLLHRLALMLTSSAQKSKQSPLETATSYARRINKDNSDAVVFNLINLAKLVAEYKTKKADKMLAPPDGAILLAEMPNKFKVMFKQISWEIKRGDGRGIGMANLGAMAVLQLVSRHRPELKQEIDAWIAGNLIYTTDVASKAWRADDFIQETML